VRKLMAADRLLAEAKDTNRQPTTLPPVFIDVHRHATRRITDEFFRPPQSSYIQPT
jgi:hypothetical protein